MAPTSKQTAQLASFLLALLASQVSAASFNLTWVDSTTPLSHIASDLTVAPALSVASTACAGTPVEVNLSAPSSWNNGAFYAVTTAGHQYESELSPAPSASSNYPVRWVTAPQYEALAGINPDDYFHYWEWSPSNDWGAMLTGIGINPGSYQSNFEKSVPAFYKIPEANGVYSTPHLAYAGLFCRGTTSIQISNGGPSFNDEFSGSQITHTAALPSNAYTVSAQFAVQYCTAAIRNTGTYPVKTARTLLQPSFQPSFTATQKTITVSDPFTCSIASGGGSATPNPVAPGNPVDFSFNFQNNGNAEITVTSITLPANPIFSNLRNLNPAPSFTVPAGGSRSVNGTVDVAITAPSGPQNLVLSVASQTTQPDCSGSIKPCNAPAFVPLQINIGTVQQPNYAPEIAAPANAVVGVPFSATITTRNIGTAAATAVSKTQINFTDSSPLLADVPALAAGASSPSVQSFTCANEGVKEIRALADANGNVTESNENDNFASQQIICGNPVLCSLQFAGHNNQFTPNDWSLVRASCTQGGSPVQCPGFSWSQTAVGASVSPASTAAANNPQTNLSISPSAPVPQSATVSAANATQGISCSLPFSVEQSYSNLTIDCSVDDPVLFPPASTIVRANCLNSSRQSTNCPALNWSTNLTEGGANLALQQTPANGVQVANTLSVPNPASQLQSGDVRITCADASQCSAICNASVLLSPRPENMTCSFLDHAPLFSPNDWALAQADCTGSANQQAACRRLLWLTDIEGGSLIPPTTEPNVSPQSNFSTTNAPVPQDGVVIAVAIDENGFLVIPFQIAACPAVTVDNVGPNYNISLTADGDHSIGGTFQVTVEVKNIGNVNVSNASTTMMFGQNCTGIDQSQNTIGLDIGETSAHTFNCQCTDAGARRLAAMADATDAIMETNELDNVGSTVFFCQPTFIPACFDYY